MTLYARGYRRHEHPLDAKGPRFLPILAQGYRDAVQGKAYRFFRTLSIVAVCVFSAILYFHPATMARQMGMRGPIKSLPDAGIILAGSLSSFVSASMLWMPLVAVFVGGGLIADDLKTRALPLYLVRPITPVDYWLGKLSIPMAAFTSVLLWPALGLFAFGVLMQPSGEVLGFAAAQFPTFLALLAHYAVVSIAYGSVMLLVSTLTERRVLAMIVGGAVFLGGAAIHGTVARSKQSWADWVRALDLPADTYRVFRDALGSKMFVEPEKQGLPSLTAALTMLTLVSIAGAIVVLRRARTVEVVS